MRKEAKSEWGSTADRPFAYMLIRPPFRTQFNSSRHPPVGGMGQSVGVSQRTRYLLWGSISESTRELPQSWNKCVTMSTSDSPPMTGIIVIKCTYKLPSVICQMCHPIRGKRLNYNAEDDSLIALDTKPLDPPCASP